MDDIIILQTVFEYELIDYATARDSFLPVYFIQRIKEFLLAVLHRLCPKKQKHTNHSLSSVFKAPYRVGREDRYRGWKESFCIEAAEYTYVEGGEKRNCVATRRRREAKR